MTLFANYLGLDSALHSTFSSMPFLNCTVAYSAVVVLMARDLRAASHVDVSAFFCSLHDM